MSSNTETHSFAVQQEEKDLRVDQFLSARLPSFSRTFFQKVIKDEGLQVNGKKITKSSYPVQPDDQIIITIIPTELPQALPKDQLPTNISTLYTGDQFIVICKPAGLTVHKPKPTFKEATLIDWLIYRFHELSSVGFTDRPGIVHRLDKDTSGILIIARTNYAHMVLSHLFKDRKIAKTYLAIVEGHPPAAGSIDFRIMRHPVLRNKMKQSTTQGREALTHYKVLTYFENAALLEVKPVTGRTHQIRVHMAAIGHPILSDLLYGHKSKAINRQALHAHEIAFSFQDKDYHFSCEIPADFSRALKLLGPELSHEPRV